MSEETDAFARLAMATPKRSEMAQRSTQAETLIRIKARWAAVESARTRAHVAARPFAVQLAPTLHVAEPARRVLAPIRRFGTRG